MQRCLSLSYLSFSLLSLFLSHSYLSFSLSLISLSLSLLSLFLSLSYLSFSDHDLGCHHSSRRNKVKDAAFQEAKAKADAITKLQDALQQERLVETSPQTYTLNPIPSTLYPQPYTLNPTSSTLHPTPSTLVPRLMPSPSSKMRFRRSGW